MVSPDKEKNIVAAQALYHQLHQSGFTYGCLEISLAALGAHITLQDIDRIGRQSTSIIEKIERTGLRVNWVVNATTPLEAIDIEQLLGGNIPLEESYPNGQIVGYLWVEHYPNNQEGHALAILPESRDNYIVMDTEFGGRISFSSDMLASATNYVLARGGSFEIV